MSVEHFTVWTEVYTSKTEKFDRVKNVDKKRHRHKKTVNLANTTAKLANENMKH